MASGSIVITDADDEVGISLSFDPPIKGDAVPTPAQSIALELFGRLVEQMKAEQSLRFADDEPAEVRWVRDEETTYATLMLVSGHDVPREALSAWTDEECRQAEDWAFSVHLHASDNDDVEVPPRPACVAAYPA